jgi:pimeloyl-ACP methyl ester carboxylesterase
MTSSAATPSSRVVYRNAIVDSLNIFYREAGTAGAPTLVLLHGFPSSSHMYRNLIPALAGRYHVIAPDYPGFGYSDAPSAEAFEYTFDHLADVVDHFLEQKGIAKYSIYIQDYGSPIGFRLATRHPERIQAIISQNGNAYEEDSPRSGPRSSIPSGRNATRKRKPKRPLSSPWIPRNINISRARATRKTSALTRGHSIRQGSIDPAMAQSNWRWPTITAPTRRSTRRGTNIFAITNRRCSLSGARTIPSFFLPEQPPSRTTSPRRRSISSTPATSLSKRKARRSLL